eukprot:TRINITY_DN3869_c1_g1_i1.p1 TRINITY_DN3869_c1_g1~~TRINITY_DN3869_c1_g1_i1.p1  ORF type:complete len:327 (+),score=59.58 TRINITY_DN3869_c1_g1_i1:120-1100(+)
MGDTDLTRLLQKAEKFCQDIDEIIKQNNEDGGGGSDSPPEETTATQSALDVLKLLEKQSVTTKILQDTKAGKRVKRLSKCLDQKVQEAALKVVNVWKEQVTKQEAQNGSNSDVKNGMNKSSESTDTKIVDDKQNTSKAESKTQDNKGKGGVKIDGPTRLITTGDTRRDAVAKKFLEAFNMVGDNEGHNPVAVAARIERALFAHFGSFNNEYKSKVKSLIFNLKDPKNPDLRGRVLSGEVDGAQFVTMTAEEMQSEAKKKEDEKIRQEVTKEAQRGMDKSEGTTDQFQCGKCKQRKCKYFQMQTRSADEPMTTFVTCMECGNKWKFC